jgi:pre-mRNA-splicing helicase BRR2
MLSLIHKLLGDVEHSVLISACDQVLEILKDGGSSEKEKLRMINEIFNLNDADFANLTQLANRITDYDVDDTMDTEIDNDVGVAVIFDQDEDEDDQLYELESASDQSEKPEDLEPVEVNEEDDSVIRHQSATKSDFLIDPTSIDLFWLQRTISKYYPDAVVSQQKTTEAFEILESERDVRDCENDLVELFNFENFELVRLLTLNRKIIVWCSKLLKCENESDKEMVKMQMREDNLNWILDKLSGVGEAPLEDSVMEESEKPTTANQPKHHVDLAALAFEQAGHLMSNTKVKLPEGSFKTSKKGYEEVHVPPPKQKILQDEKLVTIKSMPTWAHDAFINTKALNRVQSKVYPTAFESDSNVLICAPTGAGK